MERTCSWSPTAEKNLIIETGDLKTGGVGGGGGGGKRIGNSLSET